MTSYNDALRGYAHSVLKRDAFRCRYCGWDGSQWPNWLYLSWDHLLPKGHPQRDDERYIVCACRFCNECCNRTKFQVDGRAPEEIVEAKRAAINKVRNDYFQFWDSEGPEPPRMSGMFDSSKTRVQPVFKQLERRDPTGASWIEPLCRLGSRASSALPERAPWAGKLSEPPKFEYGCDAPEEFLRWLIEHADQLDRKRLVRGETETHKKRAALLDGCHATRVEALARLDKEGGGKSGPGQWQVFEGTTMVDCALFCEHATLFVEGKRIEPHLTGRVEWYAKRHQVVRNLDCLRVRQRPARRYVLTVVEQGTPLEGEAAQLDSSAPLFSESLPHLNADEVEGLRQHYLGYTTWQRIAETFGDLTLPVTTQEAHALGFAHNTDSSA